MHDSIIAHKYDRCVSYFTGYLKIVKKKGEAKCYSNPFVGTWITTSAIDDGEGGMLWGKYVFDESTVTIYSSSNKILWSQGYQSNYSWSGNTCQLQTGYSGSIRGGKLYFSFGDSTVEMERD